MFTPAELTRLATIDPRGQLLLKELRTYFPFVLLQGGRSAEEQAANVAKGVSKTLASKHVFVPSRAWDIAPAPLLWPDKLTGDEQAHAVKRFHVQAGLMLGLAHARGVPLIWGGDWDGDWTYNDQKFHDLPHFELKD